MLSYWCGAAAAGAAANGQRLVRYCLCVYARSHEEYLLERFFIHIRFPRIAPPLINILNRSLLYTINTTTRKGQDNTVATFPHTFDIQGYNNEKRCMLPNYKKNSNTEKKTETNYTITAAICQFLNGIMNVLCYMCIYNSKAEKGGNNKPLRDIIARARI